jgi:hypothetical protein
MNRGFVRGTWREFKSPLCRNAFCLMANTMLAAALGFVFWIGPHPVISDASRDRLDAK